ncbi:Uncharacterized protein, putative [Trichomonas vaginalis G3]|uniref:Uncharacterized protein, putative n=1 Tax=Trichomonas vaginalis (strain ATCC PRA-98 / G3) TaxID=412133 RepID=A2FEB6_TRIV3|nr:hypothetical protein TVAGG3_0545720 [Trichomonas vaginalis G3]EAX96756.1 Uncharacterized protein, putative [Trichomonas vaginalis G3]KAI5520163.1 hypothetical protein TVAGG3_0545720 [Trichomonas vaginalis G3]|eukprot:XP_001309686.1 Uncharacterized protein [Trichomonas vaginalis G3]
MHRTYRGKLEEEIRRTPKKEEPEELYEAPVADYKNAAEELQAENIQLENEIKELKIKISEEKKNYNQELDELFAESREIQQSKEKDENEIHEKMRIVRKQLDEIAEWYNDTDKIESDLQEAQDTASQIENEKKIICSVLDDFISIAQSIKDGHTNTSLLTSKFIQPMQSCKHAPALRKEFINLKSIMIQKAYRLPQNIGDLQDY